MAVDFANDKAYWDAVSRRTHRRAKHSKATKRQLRIGTKGVVDNAEWLFRHWCDRVIDEQGKCDYCESRKDLTGVPHPGVEMKDATMEMICSMCPSCIQDHLEMIS